MKQLNKNSIDYQSKLHRLYKTSKTTNIYWTNPYIKKPTLLGKLKTKYISTCLHSGRLKKTYKNTNVSRHTIRDEYWKKIFHNWSIKSW